jgi:hypothetical protein
MKLDDLLEKVNSKKTFLDFVEALRDDWVDEEKSGIRKLHPHGPRTDDWQNLTVETFLDSVHSFGQDSPHVSEQPDWKTFALLLYAGRFYE